jgi:cell division protein FtsZ
MRGARGLLISITGGPDLTLYEVDEAATRIREEVDPEANIILGATFDEALEGTMRVSVVATGLAIEAGALNAHDSAESHIEEPQPTRPVFGFTGKQNIPVKKPIQPAPMAVRPAAAPIAVAPAPQPVAPPAAEFAEPEDRLMDAPEAMAQAPQQAAMRSQHRMPAVEDFPPIAQKQIAAQQNRIEHIAEHAARKKMGLFERLASVGLKRKDDPAPAQREPSITAPAAAPGQQRVGPPPLARAAQPVRQQQQAPAPVPPEPAYDDDQLEIPAFLRRQAN